MKVSLGRWFYYHALRHPFDGHLTIGPVTFYGQNAMHFGVTIRSPWGWICLKPPTRCFGKWWPAYFYVSPNATPGAAKRVWGKP